jgi:hypothetical protein
METKVASAEIIRAACTSAKCHGRQAISINSAVLLVHTGSAGLPVFESDARNCVMGMTSAGWGPTGNPGGKRTANGLPAWFPFLPSKRWPSGANPGTRTSERSEYVNCSRAAETRSTGTWNRLRRHRASRFRRVASSPGRRTEDGPFVCESTDGNRLSRVREPRRDLPDASSSSETLTFAGFACTRIPVGKTGTGCRGESDGASAIAGAACGRRRESMPPPTLTT